MKTFKQFFYEAAEKTAVIAYGRYNPPTIGHEKLVQTVEDTASKVGGDAFVIPSHSQDPNKNPLNYLQKKELLQLMSDNIRVLDSGKTLISLLQELQSEGYTDIVHVAGSDRIPEFERIVNTYNNKPNKAGEIPFSFKTYKFVSAGERDPDSEGVEGMSASKLRALAREGKLQEFSSGMSKRIPDNLKKQTFEIIRNINK